MENNINFFKFYDEFQLFISNPVDNCFKEILKKIKEECKNSLKIIRKTNLSKKNQEINYLLVKNNIKGLKAMIWYLKERGELSEIKGVKKLRMHNLPKDFRNFIEKKESDLNEEDLKDLIRNSI